MPLSSDKDHAWHSGENDAPGGIGVYKVNVVKTRLRLIQRKSTGWENGNLGYEFYRNPYMPIQSNDESYFMLYAANGNGLHVYETSPHLTLNKPRNYRVRETGSWYFLRDSEAGKVTFEPSSHRYSNKQSSPTDGNNAQFRGYNSVFAKSNPGTTGPEIFVGDRTTIQVWGLDDTGSLSFTGS